MPIDFIEPPATMGVPDAPQFHRARLDAIVSDLTVGDGGRPAAATALSPSQAPSVPRPRRSTVLAVLGVIVAVGLVAAGYVLTDGFHLAKRTSAEDLIPNATQYSLPGEQYDSVDFVVGSSSLVQGSFYQTLGVIVYVLTPSEMAALNHNATVSSYTWSSGRIADLTTYSLSITIQPGPWDLVFYNPNPLNTTTVQFYSAITLGPA